MRILPRCFIPFRYLRDVLTAAYQVGLSFLSSHMRRAVAACTSPEVFFGHGNGEAGSGHQAHSAPGDPLGLAMDSLDLYNSS